MEGSEVVTEQPIGNCPHCGNPIFDSGSKFADFDFHDEAFYCTKECLDNAKREEWMRDVED